MKLLGERFLIKKDKQNCNDKIILLESQCMYPYTGKIVLVGDKIKSNKYFVNARVLFSDFNFEITNIMEDYDKENNIYVFVKEKDILCKILD